MFYCEPCRVKNDWRESIVKSRGPCEICGAVAVCHDVQSGTLESAGSSRIEPDLGSFYILGGADGHEVVSIGTRGGLEVNVERVLTWAQWFEENRAKTLVGYDEIGPYYVSTRFFGMDLGFLRHPPLLFETMAFNTLTRDACGQMRCSTWAEAEAQHKTMLGRVRALVCG